MKKLTVILISIILVGGFGWLVYYGLRHSRGIPVVIEEQERETLALPFLDREINLNKGISLDTWEDIATKEIELVYQLTVLPWPEEGLITPVTIKAFHNRKDIYFYISWTDDTPDRSIEMGKFTDATAIMFPVDEESQPSTIMMGFLGKANIWQWQASQDREYWFKKHPETKAYADFYYPFEEKELFVVSKETPKSAVNDLLAIRVGTITPKEKQKIQGRGIWNKGTWHVVFKRSLLPSDPELDAKFDLGKKRLCAFAVWNGAKGDRGGRKSISDWVELEIKK